MKILTTFEDLTGLTSSSEDANFPLTNILDLDPGIIFRFDTYSGDVWMKMDFGAAKVLNTVFLNQANVPEVKVQGHASDSWGSPSFDETFTLNRDGAVNRKGFLELTGFSYRWLRIVIPHPQDLDTGSVPQFGNLIVGTNTDISADTRQLEWSINRKVRRHQASGGKIRKDYSDYRWHTLSLEWQESASVMRLLDTFGWDHAVLFADLGAVQESWLVYPPDRDTMQVQSLVVYRKPIELEERA